MKILKNILLFGIALAVIYVCLKIFRPLGIGPSQVYGFFHSNVVLALKGRFQSFVLLPYVYLALGLTLLLEYLIPADPKQKIFSVSFFQDFIWYFYETVSDVLFIAIYAQGLHWIYDRYFSFLTISSVGHWPYWGRFALGVLLLDFLYWLQHYTNHKLPWLWELHTLHHSQKEINFFTDYRYHVLEYFIRKTILVIPFFIFAVNTPTVVIFAIVSKWYTRFYHGNIRTDLGPLRYLLVTPQSHRIHHSRLPQHRDLNFGSLFCIWDRIFKTQYEGYSEYPETGIDDTYFPHEKKIDLWGTIFLPLQQMTYAVIKLKGKVLEYFTRKS
jgi:sterol desaturase/sphingolipid hydroxylase (fatty acid hydroxylase superfamily)